MNVASRSGWLCVGLLVVAACGESTSDSGSGGGGEGGASSVAGTGGTTSAATTDASSTATTSGGDPFDCSGLPAVSFAADVQPIFTEKCAKSSCHTGTLAKSGLNLSAGQAYAELVGVETAQCNHTRQRVSGGDPSASYLLSKVRGVDLCSTSKRMPPPLAPALSDAEIDTIGAWICAGAPDD
ncbi:MAG TPA: PE-PGRS family protein [Polyangiaceae bacterium]|nr:PE-PGRS family protein [Polyangiaceae bacterium]